MPERIQLRRTKGWRMPENTVKVDRTTKWGNPWPTAAEYAVWITGSASDAKDARTEAQQVLRGKNLACWCKPGAACHADVLLVIANR